jgi:hypothetical protein
LRSCLHLSFTLSVKRFQLVVTVSSSMTLSFHQRCCLKSMTNSVRRRTLVQPPLRLRPARACLGARAYGRQRLRSASLPQPLVGMQRASHTLEDTMSLYALIAAPADVFYVVQSTGAPGRREHRLSSVLYETRRHARAELVRLSAADPGDYAIWKGTTRVEPPQWGHAVMLADGTLVPPGAGHATASAAALLEAGAVAN